MNKRLIFAMVCIISVGSLICLSDAESYKVSTEDTSSTATTQNKVIDREKEKAKIKALQEDARKKVYGSSHGSSSSSSSSSKKKSTSSSSSSSSKKARASHDAYDDGYNAIYEDDDYDWDRYQYDDDYASGVDDAIDDEDWD